MRPPLSEPRQERAFLAAVFTAKLLMAGVLYAIGFTGVSADEYTRSIFAMQWALAPHLIVGQAAWLPFEEYLDGSLLRLIPDPLWIPRLTVFIASCVLVLYFYKLVRLLFASPFAAAAATIGLLVFRWYAWMSATPMLDEYDLAAILAGLFFAARWVLERRTADLYLASAAFFLASGFHYQAWPVLAVIDAAGLWLLVTLCRKREWRGAAQLCVATVLAHLYILFTLATTYRHTGNPLAFLAAHDDFTRWYYGGYAVSWVEKLAYYPKSLAVESNPIFGAAAVYGAVLALEKGQPLRVRALLMLGAGVLAAFSVFNIWSVPPAAAPGRFALVFYVLLLPYAGLAFDRLRQGSARAIRWAVPAGVIGGTVWGLVQIGQIPRHHDFASALQVGRAVAEALQRAGPESGYLLELEDWDWLGIRLEAGHFDHQYFDRTEDHFPMRGAPSLLEADPEAFAARLRAKHVLVMAFRTPRLIDLASHYGAIILRDHDWAVLRVGP